jgi:hypothetical protein
MRPAGPTRSYLSLLFCTSLLTAIPITPAFANEKLKKDKFHGNVVSVGPKAISVKSKQNMYVVRTFNYTPQLEKKIQQKKPAPGRQITVHYFRGTDLALRVD